MDFNKYFSYKDGEIFWKDTCPAILWRGKKAGCFEQSNGYMMVALKKKKYLVHRVIWQMHNGHLESKHWLDHINRDRLDNRLENLRRATAGQNISNQVKRKNCSSNYKGVYKLKRSGKFYAQLCVNKKNIYLGYFECEKAAALAFNEAAIKHCGEFAVLNVVSSG